MTKNHWYSFKWAKGYFQLLHIFSFIYIATFTGYNLSRINGCLGCSGEKNDSEMGVTGRVGTDVRLISLSLYGLIYTKLYHLVRDLFCSPVWIPLGTARGELTMLLTILRVLQQAQCIYYNLICH